MEGTRSIVELIVTNPKDAEKAVGPITEQLSRGPRHDPSSLNRFH